MESFKFLEDNQRLSNIKRFSMHRRNREQSVAEHSHTVAFLCCLTALIEKWDSDKAFDLLCRAIFHDFVEARLGDIPSPSKRGMEEAVRQVEEKKIEEIVKGFPEEVREYLAECMKNAKNTTTEAGQVVTLADTFDVLQYAKAEESCGNKSILEDIEVTFDYIRSPEFRKMVDKHPFLRDVMERLLR